MKVYFARHGQYQNPGKVVPYRLEGFPLSDIGRQQATKQGEALKDFKIRDIFNSPIERCRETAGIIGRVLTLHPNVKEALIETGTPLQGLTQAELMNLSPNFPYEVPGHIEGGGETVEGIFERMNNFVTTLKAMSKTSSHLIVSHGDPIQIYLTKILTGSTPHTDAEFNRGKIRYIPMGGLVMLDYSQSGSPKYTEII